MQEITVTSKMHVTRTAPDISLLRGCTHFLALTFMHRADIPSSYQLPSPQNFKILQSKANARKLLILVAVPF